jgi:hypothetical protein
MAAQAQDPDLRAIKAVQKALDPLDPRSRVRVVGFVLDRLGVATLSINGTVQEDSHGS